jgi:phosphotriesterase-related protein
VSEPDRIDRNELTGSAQTVLGIISPDQLGRTLMHEHLLWDIRTPAMVEIGDLAPEIALCSCFGSRDDHELNAIE